MHLDGWWCILLNTTGEPGVDAQGYKFQKGVPSKNYPVKERIAIRGENSIYSSPKAESRWIYDNEVQRRSPGVRDNGFEGY